MGLVCRSPSSPRVDGTSRFVVAWQEHVWVTSSQRGEEPGPHSVAAMQVSSSVEGGGKRFHLQMHFLRMGSQAGISSTVQPVVTHLFAGTGH